MRIRRLIITLAISTAAKYAILRILMQHLENKARQATDETLPFNVVDHAEPNVKVVDMTVEAAAIHRATEVINKKIAAGEIRTEEELREAVLQEFSFQKIAIHEEL